MAFALTIDRYHQRTMEEIRTILRKVALELFARIVMRTPFDTGRARGNWQVEIGTITDEVLDRFDTDGGQTISEGESVISSWQGDSAIFLFNNVPYIMALEQGWSSKAANGMVRITVQEYPGIVETEART